MKRKHEHLLYSASGLAAKPLVTAEKHMIGDRPQYEAVEAIASRYIEAFTKGEYDAVRVAFMRLRCICTRLPSGKPRASKCHLRRPVLAAASAMARDGRGAGM